MTVFCMATGERYGARKFVPERIGQHIPLVVLFCCVVGVLLVCMVLSLLVAVSAVLFILLLCWQFLLELCCGA